MAKRENEAGLYSKINSGIVYTRCPEKKAHPLKLLIWTKNSIKGGIFSGHFVVLYIRNTLIIPLSDLLETSSQVPKFHAIYLASKLIRLV